MDTSRNGAIHNHPVTCQAPCERICEERKSLVLRQQKGASYGQPRQARSREEKGKENGNQAIEHTGKTKARIQTYLVTTAAIPNRRGDGRVSSKFSTFMGEQAMAGV